MDDQLDVKSRNFEQFFAHRNVFVTGGTGFLGTVLVEALLSASPDIGTIYLLVRGKYGSSPENRMKKMTSKHIFSGHSRETLKKIVPIVGELTLPKFGFADYVYEDLLQNVHIVYHSAATIKFNSNLRIAITVNLIGTERTIEFAKNLKNLVSYVYLSTAFCNSNHRGCIKEEIYQSRDPYSYIKLAENDDNWLSNKDCTDWSHMTDGHPNTYTFTKQLAENLIKIEMSGLPVGIVRPSVVYGTYEHPIRGWVGSANSGHIGFLAGYVKGLFRTFSGNAESVIDLIPCDYVINASLAIGWYVGTRKLEKPEVIHSASGEANPLTLGKFTDIMNDVVYKDPMDLLVWKPGAKLRNGLRYTLYFYIFHFFPSVCLYFLEKQFRLKRTHHTSLGYMRIFNNGRKAFDYFLNKEKDFRYSLDNSYRIMSMINPEDRIRYCCDPKEVNWTTLFERCILGLRRYHFRESYTTKPRHHLMLNIYKIVHYLSFVLLFGLIYFSLTPLIVNTTQCVTITLLIWGFLTWL